jgi:hypothetical protein
LKKDYWPLEKALKKTLKTMSILDMRGSRVGGLFAEIYVLNRLLEFEPQIGQEREKKSCDLYLNKIGERIEVKWSQFEPVKKSKTTKMMWGWSLNQLDKPKEERPDYFILVGAKENDHSGIGCVFPLSCEAFNGVSKRMGLGHKQKYVEIYQKGTPSKPSPPIEKKLNNPHKRKQLNDLSLKEFSKTLKKRKK